MSVPRQGLLLRCATFGIAVVIAAPLPSLASDSLGALLACRKIAAGAARLDCFDRESGALATQRSAPAVAVEQSAPAPAAQQSAPAPAQQQSAPEARASLNPRETFGLAPLQVAARAEAAAHAPKPLDSLTAHISGIGRAADGREIFTLDNQQVWVQLLEDGDWLDARTGEQVKISRGWLDSYWLRLPSRRGFKVKRVR